MIIARLNNSHKTELLAFLEPHAHSSMFLLSNIEQVGLEYTGEIYSGEYWSCRDETGAIQGIIAQFWNGNVMMQAPDNAALQALAEHFRKTVERPIIGFVGNNLQVQALVAALKLQTAKYTTNRSEGLYLLHLDELETPGKASDTAFQVKPAKDIETELLFDWFKAYELEAFGRSESEAHDAHITARVDLVKSGEVTWVLQKGGVPVALSGFNATLPKIVQVGPVWTPPEHRNNGYARILVAKTLEAARQTGTKHSVLFTDSPAAAKAYQAIGYKRMGDFRIAFLKEPLVLQPA